MIAVWILQLFQLYVLSVYWANANYLKYSIFCWKGDFLQSQHISEISCEAEFLSWGQDPAFRELSPCAWMCKLLQRKMEAKFKCIPSKSYMTTSTMLWQLVLLTLFQSKPGMELMELEELLGFDKCIFNVLHMETRPMQKSEAKMHSVLGCVVKNSPRLKCH